MRRIVVPAALLLAVAFCVWAYFAPHLTVRAMREAALTGDAAGFARHVDFPAVRAHLKAQFADAAAARIGGDGSGGWRDFGAALATAAAAPAIDAIASETGLQLMFTGRGLAEGLGLRLAAEPTPAAPGATGTPAGNLRMGYENASTFIVTVELGGDPRLPAKFIYTRHRWLWWKLTGLELPSLPAR